MRQNKRAQKRRIRGEGRTPPTPMINETLPPKDWPHAPVHRLDSDGIYIVTAATLHKEHLFGTSEKLTLLERELPRSRNNINGSLRLGQCSRIIITLLAAATQNQST